MYFGKKDSYISPWDSKKNSYNLFGILQVTVKTTEHSLYKLFHSKLITKQSHTFPSEMLYTYTIFKSASWKYMYHTSLSIKLSIIIILAQFICLFVFTWRSVWFAPTTQVHSIYKYRILYWFWAIILVHSILPIPAPISPPWTHYPTPPPPVLRGIDISWKASGSLVLNRGGRGRGGGGRGDLI